MKFIKPSEISGKLMSLIEESDEKVILVSPYVKISKWYKLLKKIENIKERNIDFELYVRKDKPGCDTYNDLHQTGLPYSTVPNLHAKLYMNEKNAIVTSMNLLLSSEINSLEIGYKTETKEEYDELVGFVERFVSPHNKQNSNASNEANIPNGMVWQDRFCELISKGLEHEVEAWGENSSIRIKTKRNNYECFIHNVGRENNLRISGILSGKEFEMLNGAETQFSERTGLKIELIEGKNRHYDTIWGELSNII